MKSPSALIGVAIAVLLTGCSPDASDVNSETERFTSAWVEIGATQFQSDGETNRVALTPQGPCAALAVRATTAPGVCFQLSSAVDGEGRAVVDGRSAGVFCRECQLRTSMAVESGVFVLPTEAGRFEPETGVSVRFARVDCLTLTPLATPDDQPALRIAIQPIETVPELASIDLRFLIARDSILFGDEARQQALVAHLGQELASGGVVPRLVETRELDGAPASIRFHAGDPAALAALIATAPPRADTTIDVVFGGCLLYDDPIFGPPQSLNGFTPRIPGGAGPADAVFMPSRDCFANGSSLLDLPVDIQARILTHELGHYLGLYHTVEVNDFTDQLEDTDSDNVMHSNPERAAAIGFSPLQGRIMRMHPAARAR